MQLLGSGSLLQNRVAFSTQVPKSWLSQGGGPQIPLMHSPFLQLAPHLPQFAGSEVRSVHVPE